jgi:hypothetical protein
VGIGAGEGVGEGLDPGALAGDADSLVADARQLLSYAIAYERHRGTSWEALAEWPALNSHQAVDDRYGDTVKQLNDMLTECWLLGDDPRFPGAQRAPPTLPGQLAVFDRWVTDRLADYDPLAHKAPDDPDRLFPVSGRLNPLDTAEHSSSLTAAADLIAERRRQYGPDDASVRDLELGLARRRVELYERMLADELAGKPVGTSSGELSELMSAARSRLAELEAVGHSDEG